jgi:cytochrome c oxidase subunit 3
MTAGVLDRPTSPSRVLGEGPPPGLPPSAFEGGDGSSGLFGDTNRLGMLAFMGTVSMLFIGFTSAYIVRRASADWRPLRAPGLLWLNTAILLASSLTLETARQRLRGWDLQGARFFVAATGFLGLLFVVGQLGAWRILGSQGVFLASNPHSSFFYMLTGIHAVHLLGGLVWFSAVAMRMRQMAYAPGTDALGLIALFWHFLSALWVYLLYLLFVM